jgi:hypothetical protein
VKKFNDFGKDLGAKMGRWYLEKKTEADFLEKIEIWWLKKNNYLTGLRWGVISWSYPSGQKNRISITVSTINEERYIEFSYTQTEHNGEKKDFKYKHALTTTHCKYGGERFWFLCGLIINDKVCGRRVGVLYRVGDYFACRHCSNLTYKSRNESRLFKKFPYSFIDAQWKIEEIEKDMKLRFYNGKPTRKQKRIEKIEERYAK